MNVRLRLAILFLPVLLQLCLFRLIEYSLVRDGVWMADSEASLAGILLQNAPGFFIALFLPIGVYALVRLLAPHLHPAVAAVPALGAIVLSVVVGWWGSRFGSWVAPAALDFVVVDVLILVGISAALLLALQTTTGASHKVLLVLAHVLAAFSSLLLTINFGYFLKTGTSGDWLLFWYALQTLHETRDVIASEIDWLEVSLLLLPALIALAPLLLSLIRPIRKWKPSIDPAARPYFGLVAVCTLLALSTQAGTETDVSRTAGSLFAGFVREAASVGQSAPSYVDEMPPAFDTDELVLEPTPHARPLNVVLVVLESVRADALTPYNPGLATTPFLDSLAATGLLVESMYAPVAHTTKALVPILAGVYPTLQLHFPEARPGGFPAHALPELLAPLGFRSAFFSPAPLAFENKEGLLRNMGFDVLRGDGTFDTSGFERIGYFGFEDAVVIEPAMDWVDESVRDKAPFFLSILTLTTHHPYNPPSRFAGTKHNSHLPDGYLNAVTSTDAFLRNLYAEFARRDLLDETLFVFVSDHGEAFREHGMTGHNQVLWDEVLHVPCVLHNPTIFKPGQRVTGPRSQVDILPTIAELLGLEPRNGRLPGRSLLEEATDDRVIYHSAWNSRQGLALRDATTKYMYYFRREPMRAFDVASDPDERRNLAPELPSDLRNEIERELVAWRWSVAAAYR